MHRHTVFFASLILLFGGGVGGVGQLLAQEQPPAQTGAQAAEASTASIRVNLAEEGAPVPAGVYGIFMEEINHAFDGGLYAELIQNRSFEEGVLPPGMKLVEQAGRGGRRGRGSRLKMQPISFPPGVTEEQKDLPWPWGDNAWWDPERALVGWSLHELAGSGEMRLTEANPMNAASSRSLELTVTPPSSGEAGAVSLVNSGYWGINVEQGKSYKLKFCLRPGTFRGEVTTLLESRDVGDLAAHEFGPVQPGNEWSEYTATLTATKSAPNAHFILTFAGQGTLQVDWVSLFPPTWRDKPNGLRPDLAQYLADLKPAIVRYPGGCYVEGFSWESAPDWRTMVVPPEERPGTWSYWKYRSTDGFGYHEFLEFAEDIGAEPLYVTWAGMTVHPEANMPMEDLDPVIQQALDAIDYANGPVDSKWGAVRAKMGHPEPFGLKYIEIGNEHNAPIYGEYYVKFREAIKAKYPDVTVIMSMYWGGLNRRAIRRAGDENIDMVDEHAYHNAEWPRQNFNYFDRYDRSVPWTVFVGEYASQRGTGDWGCGMGDSVYLMMIERNGDIVKMATYAPLFVNVNDRTWDFNLIEYDASRSFAHGSYYVQKTFNENRPDVNLATEFSPAAGSRRRGRGRRGGNQAGGGQRRGRGATALPWFFAQAGYDRDAQEVIVKATNFNSVAVPVEIQLDGATWVGASGKHIVVRGDDPRQDNTLDEPRRIVPQEQPLEGVADKFSVTLAPYSVNVLRIPARKE